VGFGVPLEQLIPLLLDSGGLLVILSRPRRQILERFLGILRDPMGLSLPQPETGHLLG